MLIIYQKHIKKLCSMAIIRNRLSLIILSGLLLFSPLLASAASLNGRILLQVESHGEAWYVNPVNSQRYYLGRPNDAFSIMRSLGLGVSNANIESYLSGTAPNRLSGRILLQVEDKGQAFFVNPLNLKLYYLGRPADAFNIMRSLGLGISNTNLNSIAISANSPALPQTTSNIPVSQVDSNIHSTADDVKNFSFKYKNISKYLSLNMSSATYNAYRTADKTFSYPANNPPTNIREEFYGMFLKFKTGDASVDDLVTLAKKQGMSDRETLEYLLALVQYIPYDYSKVSAGVNNNPFFPYETLYLNKGVCSDKTFLAITIARKLGYASAMLDFPDINHSALGIACPVEYSLRATGYCYVETTNYFPFGVIPQSIADGQAQKDSSSFDNLFNDSLLGKLEIYQKSPGKIYDGMNLVVAEIERIKDMDRDLDRLKLENTASEQLLRDKELVITAMRQEMDAYLAQDNYAQYNAMVPEYNEKTAEYNSLVASYKDLIAQYNNLINQYNQAMKSFYQK